MTDFDRFKLRKARQIRNKIRTLAYYRLKKRAAKERVKKSTQKGELKEKKEESKQKKAEPKQKKEVPKKK
jgi:large subunit ribosomal protein L14e